MSTQHAHFCTRTGGSGPFIGTTSRFLSKRHGAQHYNTLLSLLLLLLHHEASLILLIFGDMEAPLLIFLLILMLLQLRRATQDSESAF
jgi:hypothetical protein